MVLVPFPKLPRGYCLRDQAVLPHLHMLRSPQKRFMRMERLLRRYACKRCRFHCPPQIWTGCVRHGGSILPGPQSYPVLPRWHKPAPPPAFDVVMSYPSPAPFLHLVIPSGCPCPSGTPSLEAFCSLFTILSSARKMESLAPFAADQTFSQRVGVDLAGTNRHRLVYPIDAFPLPSSHLSAPTNSNAD